MHNAGSLESTTTETCTARTNNNCHAKRISARRLYRLKLAWIKRSCPGWIGTGHYRLVEYTKKAVPKESTCRAKAPCRSVGAAPECDYIFPECDTPTPLLCSYKFQ
ncbi:hypothetical protein RZS08_34210, partial [Arthrospira platensis SPKY1]|nr:hypothetical protein [Arthrospira platensis SPKY1]